MASEVARVAECYLVVRPATRKGRAEIVKMTKGVPYDVPGNAILVKIALEVPERAFRPPFFEAAVDVPEDYVGRIIVQATDPAPPEE
jgi:hypothetical protein